MEKQKKWQLALIVAVLALTLYNILPTIFYYSKPLDKPVDAPVAKEIVSSIVERVDGLKEDGIEWLESFNSLLGIKAKSIEVSPQDAQFYIVTFANEKEAARFSRYLPRAGAMIPFVPAQLALSKAVDSGDQNSVVVQRNVAVDLTSKEADSWFAFSPLRTQEGKISPLYYSWVSDRVVPLLEGLGGKSPLAMQAGAVAESNDERSNELLLRLSSEVNEVYRSLGVDSPVTKRLFSAIGAGQEGIAATLAAKAELLKTGLEQKLENASKRAEKGSEGEAQISSRESISLLKRDVAQLNGFIAILKGQSALFTSDVAPINEIDAKRLVDDSFAKVNQDQQQVISLDGHNPFFDQLVVDWDMGQIDLVLNPYVQKVLTKESSSEKAALEKEKLGQLLINEVAFLGRLTDEDIKVDGEKVSISLSSLLGTTGILGLDLGQLAQKQLVQIQHQIQSNWSPEHADFKGENYPVLTYEEFLKLPAKDQKLGLVVYAPAYAKSATPQGFRTSSIYVIAKGLQKMYKQVQDLPSLGNETWVADFERLNQSLQQRGFIGYPGSLYGIDPAFKDDYIFELSDYYNSFINSTREGFEVKGSKKLAVLPLSTIGQRIMVENEIGDQIQENLLKWREDYGAAQVDLNPINHLSVPKPTKNPFWENLKLSFVKYFRGDERKVLNWGLDLSGGKAVRIGLVDHSGKPVTNPDDLRQAVDELYQRINKLGVSERTIRIEDKNILLEFPGSQGLSASELVKASSMTFHIVNEKFGSANPLLADAVNRFLQEVWNEAVVTNQKDIDSINRMAWQRLGKDEEGAPRSEYANLLYSHGLRLGAPGSGDVSSTFNDTLSSVARLRGDTHADWNGQTHPLLFVFRNYATEGASLTNVRVGYDPTEGNTLSFDIKGRYDGAGRTGNPRDELYAWTSTFSEESIVGTPLEAYSKGHGWRMAVILNDQVISAPALRGALREHASITGRFSQREVNQLAADLKAGSLTFTPKILSENNISPDLGKEERAKGIVASLISLALVVVAMVGYYRFAGAVASCAVIFNLLIMWGVLQNIDAALTLPGIAGIVLTIGMAVDANVLVFERIREEFAISGRIASAIGAGYRKAFSAIVDSNITTIIAALILIQFDSGPIKGFAVTLIIGIVSSMFTALFMTRYFFAGWIKKGHKELRMSQFITGTKFDFLSKTKIACLISALVIIVGGIAFYQQRNSIIGMDFTGGYALTVEVADTTATPRLAVQEALVESGAPTLDVQVRELSRPNQLRIQLGRGMEESGAPFYQMADEVKVPGALYGYQLNPRLDWVVNALESHGIKIQESALTNLSNNWTVMSGQFSDAMQRNAVFALLFALGAILVYITFRFQFKYAISAVIGLVHDVLLTLAVLALFHLAGFPVQIDLVVIGAIMTLIGYSLNDTIIVFDRIREDLKLMRKSTFTDVVNHSINITLSRTIMTSGTTLLVLVSLLLLGGPSIFAFSLVMSLGVLFGTGSSLFIAPAALRYFHEREEEPSSKNLKLKNGF